VAVRLGDPAPREVFDQPLVDPGRPRCMSTGLGRLVASADDLDVLREITLGEDAKNFFGGSVCDRSMKSVRFPRTRRNTI